MLSRTNIPYVKLMGLVKLSPVRKGRGGPPRKCIMVGNTKCYFTDDIDQDQYPENSRVEVMIVRPIYDQKRSDDTKTRDVVAILVRPVDHEKHTLMRVDYFQRNEGPEGSRTDGISTIHANDFGGKTYVLYPGSTGAVLDNPDSSRPPKKQSMNVWVLTEDLNHDDDRRICTVGLTRLADAKWRHYLRKYKKR